MISQPQLFGGGVWIYDDDALDGSMLLNGLADPSDVEKVIVPLIS